jgi:hypothetical protein
VVFDGPRELAGKIITVEIERVDAFTLFGRACGEDPSQAES